MSDTAEIDRPGPRSGRTKPKSDEKRPLRASGKTALTKKAKLGALVARKRGATLDQLQKELGWQPHTARAAISRLRKAGHEIDLTETNGRKAYRRAI
jgi:hypothetical protein